MEYLLWLTLSILCFILPCEVAISSNLTNTRSIPHLCPHDQKAALLQFKETLTVDMDASLGCVPSYPKILSWDERFNNSDCCLWDGVACDRMTGRVIELDLSCSRLKGTISNSTSGLFHLRSLERLNLAHNDFDGVSIPSVFGGFANLTHLNLSDSDFFDLVPSEISHLSKLVSLDLSDNYVALEEEDFNTLLGNLTRLEELVLRGVIIHSTIPDFMMNLSSLGVIDLCETGLQGNVPSRIFSLRNLRKLCLGGGIEDGLTGSFPNGNWTYSSSLRILELSAPGLSGELHDSIGNLKDLTSLSLQNLNFTGQIPHSIGNLQSLTYLSIRFLNLTGEIPDSIGNLRALSYLDIFNTNLNGKLPDSIGKLKGLEKLDLAHCNFSGSIPESLGNLTRITNLGLFHNNFNGQVPITLSNLKQLTSLDLSNNHLEGNIPDDIVTLVKLNQLVLSKNALNGTLPRRLFTLPSLQYLDLSSNRLTGHIPNFTHRLPLQYISLSNNRIEGPIPSGLFDLPSLNYLDLSSNRLTGQIRNFPRQSSLEYISLNKNLLQGPIPPSLVNLVNLTYLGLSSNNLQGVLELPVLSALNNLQSLDLSRSGLSISTDRLANTTFPSLRNLYLASCNISEFPEFVKDYSGLYLNLESNNIHGQVPKWVEEVSFDYLDISRNYFEGPLPTLLTTTSYFLASHNKFTGEISSFVCDFSSLKMLDVSYNDLSGAFPSCLGNFSDDLSVLNLRKNRFRGTIPSSFSEKSKLRTLNLNGNFFEGPIPLSLANCGDMELLDLGNNKLNGTFPRWAESSPKLRVLILHSNEFEVPIITSTSTVHDPFASLRIFDISKNGFGGLLPEKYFLSFTTMKHVKEDQPEAKYMGSKDGYYQDSIVVVWKGSDVEFEHIITTLTTIDLSANKFKGEIPEAIHELNSLRLLNLSHNSLAGSIPASLGNLANLEILDLSSNTLTGSIPRTLVSINSLSNFNVSRNHLVGPIPRGKQFETFENNSYIENSGLCGFPLSRLCGDYVEPPPPKEDHSIFSDGLTWKIVMFGYICGVPFGLIIGFLMLLFGQPSWFARIAEKDHGRKIKGPNQSATEEIAESSSTRTGILVKTPDSSPSTWEIGTSSNVGSQTETGQTFELARGNS